MVLVDCINIISEGAKSPEYNDAINLLLESESLWGGKFSPDQICRIVSAISNNMAKQGRIDGISTLFEKYKTVCRKWFRSWWTNEWQRLSRT